MDFWSFTDHFPQMLMSSRRGSCRIAFKACNSTTNGGKAGQFRCFAFLMDVLAPFVKNSGIPNFVRRQQSTRVRRSSVGVNRMAAWMLV